MSNATSLFFQYVLMLMAIAFSACTNAQHSSGNGIVVDIPLDAETNKYTYTGTKPGSEGLSTESAHAWSVKHLDDVKAEVQAGAVKGTGKFTFSQELKVVGTVKKDFTANFSCDIRVINKQYRYVISDIVLKQKGLAQTSVTLEEFINQYKNQQALSEDIVAYINGVLQSVDRNIREYVKDMERSL
jgi:hypothetical protein